MNYVLNGRKDFLLVIVKLLRFLNYVWTIVLCLKIAKSCQIDLQTNPKCIKLRYQTPRQNLCKKSMKQDK